jgi:hypothetical protein
MPATPDALPGDPPPVPASRFWWAVPAVSLVLLTVVAMVFGEGPQRVDHGTSYDASAGGFRAVFLLLEELQFPVERSRRPAEGEVRWVLFPTRTTEKDAAPLDAWVRNGGVVLLALDDPEFAEHLGLKVSVSGGWPREKEVGAWPRLSAVEKGESTPAAAPDVASLLAGPVEVTGPPGGREWGRVGDGPLVTIYPRGRGAVWLLHRPDVLANVNLRGEDNAVVACRLAEAMLAERPGGRLAFDEYCHGLRDRPSAAELLFRPPVLAATLQALLLTALAVWHSAVRFGPMRPAPPPGRRSKEEFLDAMAELLARNGDRAEAFRTVRDDLLRRLQDDLGLPAGTPVARTVEEAAGRRGIRPEPLLRLLTADAPPGGASADAFLAALHDLETAAHEYFRSRPRTR